MRSALLSLPDDWTELRLPFSAVLHNLHFEICRVEEKKRKKNWWVLVRLRMTSDRGVWPKDEFNLPIWPYCAPGWIIATLLQCDGRGSFRHFRWYPFAVLLLLNHLSSANAWPHINLLRWVVWLHGTLVLWAPRWIHRWVWRVNLWTGIQANVLLTIRIRVLLVLMWVLHLLIRALLYRWTVIVLFGCMQQIHMWMWMLIWLGPCTATRYWAIWFTWCWCHVTTMDSILSTNMTRIVCHLIGILWPRCIHATAFTQWHRTYRCHTWTGWCYHSTCTTILTTTTDAHIWLWSSAYIHIWHIRRTQHILTVFVCGKTKRENKILRKIHHSAKVNGWFL